MVAFPRIELGVAAGRGDDPEGVALEDVGDPVVGAAQADGGQDDRAEHDLPVERRARHDREHLVRRGLSLDGLALRVVQALAGERRRDPGPQDRRVHGLGQVVGRAHLEAADHAVELVDAGDDDDRDMAQGGIGGERGERLVAIHDGHDDVEEDDVDRRRVGVPEPVQGLLAVARLDRLVAQALEQPREQLPIERRVVDDEDASGIRAAVRRHQARPPATAGRALEMAASSSSGRIGLMT